MALPMSYQAVLGLLLGCELVIFLRGRTTYDHFAHLGGACVGLVSAGIISIKAKSSGQALPGSIKARYASVTDADEGKAESAERD
jgi:membrane associated rhomboid family serine protease